VRRPVRQEGAERRYEAPPAPKVPLAEDRPLRPAWALSRALPVTALSAGIAPRPGLGTVPAFAMAAGVMPVAVRFAVIATGLRVVA
jgi:hypothetical protein